MEDNWEEIHLKPNILVCTTGLWFNAHIEASSWGGERAVSEHWNSKMLKGLCKFTCQIQRNEIRIDVIFNYRDASENSGWICPKVQVNFAANILIRGSSLKLQKVLDIFLSPVRKDLDPRSCCMPGIKVTLASCFCWFLETHLEFKMRQQMFASIFTAPSGKKEPKENWAIALKQQSKCPLGFEKYFPHGWWRLVLFISLPTCKFEVLVWKILMEKQHFKQEDLLSKYSDTWNTTKSPATPGSYHHTPERWPFLAKKKKKKVQIKQTHNCVVFCCWQRLFKEWRIIKMLVIVLFIDSNLITSCLYCQCIFPHRW